MGWSNHYPTIDGCPVPTCEIWLPETNLRQNPNNRNNHHLCWTARNFGHSILYVMFRTLEAHQEVMQRDVHDWIHDAYSPPELPTPLQAMNRLEQAYWLGENLKKHDSKGYRLVQFGKDILDICKQDYGKMKP